MNNCTYKQSQGFLSWLGNIELTSCTKTRKVKLIFNHQKAIENEVNDTKCFNKCTNILLHFYIFNLKAQLKKSFECILKG